MGLILCDDFLINDIVAVIKNQIGAPESKTYKLSEIAQAIIDIPSAPSESNISTMWKMALEPITSTVFEDTFGIIFSVPSYWFSNNIKSIKFPLCITIDATAFARCSSLTEVSFPACITIGNNAFIECNHLPKVSFPVCTTIGSSAFQYCSTLSEVNFPKCTEIGSFAFAYCSYLNKISFPVCTTIKGCAFQYCSTLSEIDLPACTEVYNHAFLGCTSLTKISLPVCTAIHTSAFCSCSRILSAVFPNCTQVDDFAFENCSNLRSIRFDNVVSFTGINVFKDCNSLLRVEFLGDGLCTKPYFSNSVENDGFFGSFNIPDMYVPNKWYISYITSPYWRIYYEHIHSLNDVQEVVAEDVVG